MYEVIKDFADLQDGGYIYRVGEIFPREGTKVTIDRATELLGAENKAGEPLIAEIVTEAVSEKVPEPKKKKAKEK